MQINFVYYIQPYYFVSSRLFQYLFVTSVGGCSVCSSSSTWPWPSSSPSTATTSASEGSIGKSPGFWLKTSSQTGELKMTRDPILHGKVYFLKPSLNKPLQPKIQKSYPTETFCNKVGFFNFILSVIVVVVVIQIYLFSF